MKVLALNPVIKPAKMSKLVKVISAYAKTKKKKLLAQLKNLEQQLKRADSLLSRPLNLAGDEDKLRKDMEQIMMFAGKLF